MIKKLFTLIVASTTIFSCSNDFVSSSLKKEKNSILVNISTNQMSLKASTNKIPRKLLTDVKYVEVYLVDNSSDPFSSSIVIGPQTITSITSSSTVRFTDIPEGGIFYAVAGAFDNASTEIDKINITQPNASITSLKNQWSLSSNSVEISKGSFTYSNGASGLELNLQLQNEVPVNVETQINHIEGNLTIPSFEVM